MWKVAAVGVGAVGVLLGSLFYFQEKLLYHPSVPGMPTRTVDNPPQFQSPAAFGLPFREAMVRGADGTRVHTWLVLAPDAVGGATAAAATTGGEDTAASAATDAAAGSAAASPQLARLPTIVFFHGNAANMGWRLPFVRQLVLGAHCNVLMVEYRGFGMSEGVPSEEGLAMDAEAALRYARRQKEVSPDGIFVFGRSLGGAVAIQLAQRFPDHVAGVVVENTFLSIAAMVDHLFPLLTPFKGFLRMHYPSKDRIGSLHQPLLFISGANDDLVPPFHVSELHDRATSSSGKRIVHVAGGQHHDTWELGGEKVLLAVRDFVHGRAASNRGRL